jgi:hypothetical protein
MNIGFMAVSAAIIVSGVFWMLGRKHLERDTALIAAAEAVQICNSEPKA